MLREEIANISLLLVLATAALYSCGLVFYLGFLSRWGIEETLFPLSFERTLFQGFTAIGPLSVIYFAAYYAVVYLILYLAGILFRYLKKTSWFTKLYTTSEQRAPHTQKDDASVVLKLTEPMITLGYWGLIILSLWITLATASNKLGIKSATSQIDRFASGKESSATITHKDLGPLEGYSIVCSSSHCAFLIGSDVKILRLEDIQSFSAKVIKL